MSDERKSKLPEMAAAHLKPPSLDGIVEAIHQRDAQLVHDAFQRGFKMGWEQAYKRMKDAFSNESIADKLKSIAPTVQLGDSTVIVRTLDGDSIGSHHSGGHPIGTKEIVSNFIGRMQGLRGVDLISKLNAEGFDLQERTIRTALHRLKKSGDIKVVDGRWYTPDSAPPDPLSLEPEEDDDAAAS